MPNLRNIQRVRGAIHSLRHFRDVALDNQCHVLFVSDTTLKMLEAFARAEAQYIARWALDIEENGDFLPIESGTDLAAEAQEFINRMRVEIMTQDCDLSAAFSEIVYAIDRLTNATYATGVVPGTLPPEVHLETLPGVEGEPPPDGYEVFSGIAATRCKASHMLVDASITILTELEAANVPFLAFTGLAAMSAAVSAVAAILATTPLGWGLAMIFAIGAVAAELMTTVVDLEEMASDIGVRRDELVCAMLEEENATSAHSAFMGVMETSPSSWDADSTAIMSVILTIEAFTATMFKPLGALGEKYANALAVYVPPNDCTCGGDANGYIKYRYGTSGPSQILIDGVAIYEFTAGNYYHASHGDAPTMLFEIQCIAGEHMDVLAEVIAWNGITNFESHGGVVYRGDTTMAWHYAWTDELPVIGEFLEAYYWHLATFYNNPETEWKISLRFSPAVRPGKVECP